jgi:cytidine deaminase
MSLDPDSQELVDAARTVSANAYAPYSNFQVGAAVLSGSGAIYTACNVENASYPIGTCAERNAIAKGVATEGPGFLVTAIAVVAVQNGRQMPCSPCGACRQAIAEFGRNSSVIFADESGNFISAGLGDLLPRSFRLQG